MPPWEPKDPFNSIQYMCKRAYWGRNEKNQIMDIVSFEPSFPDGRSANPPLMKLLKITRNGQNAPPREKGSLWTHPGILWGVRPPGPEWTPPELQKASFWPQNHVSFGKHMVFRQKIMCFFKDTWFFTKNGPLRGSKTLILAPKT